MEPIIRLHEILATDRSATEHLFSIEDQAQFISALLEFAAAHQIGIGAAEIEQFINAGRRSWLEQRHWN